MRRGYAKRYTVLNKFRGGRCLVVGHYRWYWYAVCKAYTSFDPAIPPDPVLDGWYEIIDNKTGESV